MGNALAKSCNSALLSSWDIYPLIVRLYLWYFQELVAETSVICKIGQWDMLKQRTLTLKCQAWVIWPWILENKAYCLCLRYFWELQSKTSQICSIEECMQVTITLRSENPELSLLNCFEAISLLSLVITVVNETSLLHRLWWMRFAWTEL